MAKKEEDNRDVFEKALDGDYELTGNQAAALLATLVMGGTVGGRALAKRLARKSTRAAENAALARASKDGSLGWGRGKDAKVLNARDNRVLAGGVIGGTAGMIGGVYAGTRKKKENRK